MSFHVDSTSREMSCNTLSSLTSTFRTASRNTSEIYFDRKSQRLGGRGTTPEYRANPFRDATGRPLPVGDHVGGAAARMWSMKSWKLG